MTPGLKGIPHVRDINITDKKVFLRLDLNVPLKGKEILDETRIQEALPTIRYCMEQRSKLVLASHLGRPEGFDAKYSMEPVAKRLSELLNAEVHLVEDPSSETPHALLPGLKRNQILLLENLRFIEGEQKNDDKFAKIISEYTDVYINDAFGASHRAHATIEALPRIVKEKGIGFLMEKEIQWLDKVLYNYESPYAVVLGGSKVSDKIGVLDALVEKADIFIIGGAMAYTFLAAQRHSTGLSRVEKDRVTYAREFIQKLEVRNKSLFLPVDHYVVQNINEPTNPTYIDSPSIPDGKIALDIGPKTASMYAQVIQKSKTVFWNGPMGMYETTPFEKGTFEIAKAVSLCNGMTIVGGGDSVSALNASGHSKVSHISTGGGASLEYLQGDKLAGLEVFRSRR